MFDRGVLFVGSGGVGLGVLAEVLAIDILRQSASDAPLRVYSATMRESADIDSVLLRAMERQGLDTAGTSLKPLALYAFAGAPRLDHVIMLDASLPAATKLALSDTVDVRRWSLGTEDLTDLTPGDRMTRYMSLTEKLRPRITQLLTELTTLDGVEDQTVAQTA